MFERSPYIFRADYFSPVYHKSFEYMDEPLEKEYTLGTHGSNYLYTRVWESDLFY